MRKIIGLLAILLGVTGVLVLITCGVAVWRVEGVVVDRTERVATRASERLTKAEGRLQRLEGKVKHFAVDVEVIRTAAARLVGRVVKNALASTELNQLFERLNLLLEQSEELAETLDIVARLFEDTADLSAQFDGRSERTETLQNVADSFEQASAALAGIRAELADIRLRGPAAQDPQKLADLCARSRGPLERIAGGIASIRAYSVEVRESLEQFRREVRFWLRTGAALLTLVFVWLGLGQACLIGWGWRRLRPTPTFSPGDASGGPN